MLQYPNFNPVALAITDNLQIYWYGLMYILGFVIAWWLMRLRTRGHLDWQDPTWQSDLFFYLALGVLLGGRLGYMLFYNLHAVLENPWSIVKTWQGGMSFHGGLIGVLLAIGYFSYRKKLRFIEICDLLAPTAPLGLGLGRLGNFINGELWGRPTDVPWAMVFPHPLAGEVLRHPSPLYGVLLEGILLFILLWCYAKKPRPPGAITGLFLSGYAIIRFIEEFFRAPDIQYGFIAWDWLTMGQLLSFPMLLAGGILLIFSAQKLPKNR